MILIIDDDDIFRSSLKKYLEEEEFITLTVENARQAFNILHTQLPDIIILDLILPEITGYQFLKSLRETVKWHYIPVIVLSAKDLAKDRIQAYSLGCNAYLSKPFNIDELISIIYNLLRHSTNYLYRLKFSQLFQKQSFENNNNYNVPTNLELTPKEQRTLNLVTVGYMNKEIAKILNVSNRHVERYISKLFQQFGVNTRTELVKIALQNTYITN